jgi:hypothetical protein
MAWRIEESVVRGEIDNRTRGSVVGRIWFVGREAPVELDLTGNAWRDLAGRRLEFVNPDPKPGVLVDFATRQTGVIGDCTASRKVKVPDIPLDQIGAYLAGKKPFPWHWGNSLYLEWYGTANGRVVIESASFLLTVDEDLAWEMSPQEEEAQRQANAAAMTNFVTKLGDFIDPATLDAATPAAPAESTGDGAMTEAEAEKLQEESDQLADRINARVEREGMEHYERILEEEVERRRKESDAAPLTPEQEAGRVEWFGERDGAAEEGAPDPELQAELRLKHPLDVRALALSSRLLREPQERGWLPPDATSEHVLVDLISSVAKAAVKLAGALDGRTWPPERAFCAGSIVRLKRARAHLDHALLAVTFCDENYDLDVAWLAELRRELVAIGRESEALVTELRARLAQGFD